MPRDTSRCSHRRLSPYQPAVTIALLLYLLAACSSPTQTAADPLLPQPTVHPTLTDFWDGRAQFIVERADTGLPMGESDTLLLDDGTVRSYVHAGAQSLGVVDRCGAPVEFPGCVVPFISRDRGVTFVPPTPPVCLIPCAACPCDSKRDHIDQQQYPRVERYTTFHGPQWVMVYEYRANVILRRSADGLTWSPPAEIPLTGIWRNWLMPCPPHAAIGPHPHTPQAYDCLIGSPPGLYIDSRSTPPELYVFVGLGQNPGSMGCLRGPVDAPPSLLRACDHNPLFTGNPAYGPLASSGPDANAHFDFRTISSAEVIRLGDRYYMLYEGVRGPTPGAAGDTQFLLGLARSREDRLDGPWELYPGNPILLDLPGNVGVGHADLLQLDGVTYLYTSLDGERRSRLQLVWR